jgi:hypothetical protein
MYNETRVQHVLGMGTTTHDFNCWGATQFVANGSNTLSWVEYSDMHEWLTTQFEPIPKGTQKEGDIVALFSGDKDHLRLVHTAYQVGTNRYVHKLGSNRARLETLKGVLKAYADVANGYVFLRSKKCV